MFLLTPFLTFLFIFSIVVLVTFGVNLTFSMMSNPPKPYEFKRYETTTYMMLLSYVVTYIIYLF
jgi:hypothetical protein